MEGGFFRADLPLFMIRTLPNCRVCLLFNGGICENIKRKHSAYNDNEYIQVVPPTEFSPVQMQVLRAAPEHVDVMHLNQFYFILSKHIVRLIPGYFSCLILTGVFSCMTQAFYASVGFH